MVEANKPIRKTLRPCKEESKDWDKTENLYIEGDNLEVLKLLQESYLNKVKMIYIDPPYNTGNDFIYNDDFKMDSDEYKDKTGEVDEEGNRLFKNTDTNGRFHSDWCSMMYSRLMLARNLLSEDGVIFISIDDNEQQNMKNICNEIFGEQNFISEFPRVTKKGGKSTESIAKNHDYILMFSKNKSDSNLKGINHIDDGYCNKDEYYTKRGFYKLNQTLDYDSLNYNKSLDYIIKINDCLFYPGGDVEAYKNRKKGIHSRADWAWRWSEKLFKFGFENGFIEIKEGKDRRRIYTKTYEKVKIEKVQGDYIIKKIERTKPISTLNFCENKYSNDNAKKNLINIFGSSIFDYTKPISLIELFLQMTNDKEAIILDFFSGSATTAHAVMDLNAEDGGNRKFIMVQLPEECDEKSAAYKAGYKNICEIGKERIRRAGDKIKSDNADKEGIENLDTGFRVLKVDDTNMKDVYYTPDKYSQRSLFDLESNIKEDRTELDLLYGCLIDWGLPLNHSYESNEIEGSMVHIYNDGDLIACFDEDITEEAIKKIAKMEPLRAVFRDSSFKTSAEKINVEEIFKLLSSETSVRVI